MKTAAIVRVKDEEDRFAEWIAYHLHVGFDTIIVLDDGSTDETLRICSHFAYAYDVRIKDVSTRTQLDAYNDAMNDHKAEFDWVAVIDSDEFIVFNGRGSLFEKLRNLDASAVCIPWAIFGSSGVRTPRPDALVIEQFVKRSHAFFPANFHVKSIVRPSRSIYCISPHRFNVRGPEVLLDGSVPQWSHIGGILATTPDFTMGQINHYFTRSHDEWAQKIARGHKCGVKRDLVSDFILYDRNEVTDLKAFVRSKETKRILTAMGIPALNSPISDVENYQRRDDARATALAAE